MSADSTAVADSVTGAAAAQDSAARTGSAVAESAAAVTNPPPANTEGPLAGETHKAGGTMGQRNPPTDSIVGRDSAYAPIGAIDSNGRVRPIKR